MNQLRDWEGRCQRCSAVTDVHIMSMFDVALICMDCSERERLHPKYSQARDEEEKEMNKGNFNFSGIGFPEGE